MSSDKLLKSYKAIDECPRLSPSQVTVLSNLLPREVQRDEGKSHEQFWANKHDALGRLLKSKGIESPTTLERERRIARGVYRAATGTRWLNKFNGYVTERAIDATPLIPDTAKAAAQVLSDAQTKAFDKALELNQEMLFDEIIDPQKYADKIADFVGASPEERKRIAESVLYEDLSNSEWFGKLEGQQKDTFLFSAIRMLARSQEELKGKFGRFERRQNLQEDQLKQIGLRTLKSEIALKDMEDSFETLSEQQRELADAYDDLSDRVDTNTETIERNRATIDRNSGNIKANKKEIEQNRLLTIQNKAAIHVLKQGMYGFLGAQQKIDWLKSGFYRPPSMEVQKEIDALEEQAIQEKRVKFLNSAQDHLTTVSEAGRLLENLGIGGEAPRAIMDAASHGMQAANVLKGLATGNYGQALGAINGLLFGGNPAAERHQQLVGLIEYNKQLLEKVLENQRRILQSLQRIEARLDRIERKIDAYHNETMFALYLLQHQLESGVLRIDELLGKELRNGRSFLSYVGRADDIQTFQIRWETRNHDFNAAATRLSQLCDIYSPISEFFRMGSRAQEVKFEKVIYSGLISEYEQFRLRNPHRASLFAFLEPSVRYAKLLAKSNALDESPDAAPDRSFRVDGRLLDPVKAIEVGELVLELSRIRVLRNGSNSIDDLEELNSEEQIRRVRANNEISREELSFLVSLLERTIAQETLLSGDVLCDWLADRCERDLRPDLFDSREYPGLLPLARNTALVWTEKRLAETGASKIGYHRALDDQVWLSRVLGLEGPRLVLQADDSKTHPWALVRQEKQGHEVVCNRLFALPSTDELFAEDLMLRPALPELIALFTQLSRELLYLTSSDALRRVADDSRVLFMS